MTKMLRPRYWCSALAVGLALSAFVPAVQAAPPGSGTQATPMGLADFMAGVLPPPGTYWLNYLVYVNKNELLNHDGKKKMSVPVPLPEEEKGPAAKGVPLPPGHQYVEVKTDLKASAIVEAARFVWMSPYKLFGATYGAQVIFPFYYADMKLDLGGAPAVRKNAKGLGDIVINPIILAWHFSPNFHMGAGLDIIAPTGRWDPDNAASQLVTSNVWTFEPLVAISYWQPGGLDLSAKIMYDFHTTNRDWKMPWTSTMNQKPGQEFHFDWGASWGFGKGDEFRAGLVGFAYFQTTEDELEGEKLEDTKGRQFGAGAGFKWWPNMGPFSLEGKAMKEFGTRNGAQGYTVWLNSVLAL